MGIEGPSFESAPERFEDTHSKELFPESPCASCLVADIVRKRVASGELNLSEEDIRTMCTEGRQHQDDSEVCGLGTWFIRNTEVVEKGH
jgi:hypothetical protein